MTFGLGSRLTDSKGQQNTAFSGGDCSFSDESLRDQVPVNVDVANVDELVVSALANALTEATKAGQWAIVATLAKELEARRLAAVAPPVVRVA